MSRQVRSGRPKGSGDKQPRSEARLLAQNANAVKPRPKVSPETRQRLVQAKDRLAELVSGPGLDWLATIIREGPAHWVLTENGKVLESGSADFPWAMNFAADRGGLIRVSELDVKQPGSFTITVNDSRDSLGWPDPSADGGGARDEHDRPAVAN